MFANGGTLSGRRFERVGPGALLLGAALFQAAALPATPVAVRYKEGVVRGFLALRTLEGNPLADGDWIQFARGDRVTSREVFHFRDGSVHDETVVFVERGSFRLVNYHLVQKGPSFPHPMEVSIDGKSGLVTVHSSDENGKEKIAQERMKLPADVANGLVLTLMKNLSPGVPETTMSMVAATPEPRLVKLVISPKGEEPFSIGSSSHKAMRYAVKLGGVAGLLAPLVGKSPDTDVWILLGDAPAFVKSEGPLYLGGPVWRIELTSPVWPQPAAATRER